MLGRLVSAKRVCDRVHVRRLRRAVRLRELVVTMMVVLSVRIDDRLTRQQMEFRLDEFRGGKLRDDGVSICLRCHQLRLRKHEDR